MSTQYDGRDVAVIYDGSRIEQVQTIATPDESYGDREFSTTLGNEDEDVYLQDLDSELEGEITLAPTSGSIPSLDAAMREGSRAPLTIRFPEDHAKTTESYSEAVFTEASDDDFEGEDANNRSYTFIANDVESE